MAYAGVSQLAEGLTCNEDVAGSIPVASSIFLGMAQFGRALGLGPRRRGFKSLYLDQRY